jgi:hypothetical protein
MGIADTNNRSYNLYCDESCHLERDPHSAMVIGTTWCSSEQATAHAHAIRELKTKHGLNEKFEIKWTKVSAAKAAFYLDVVDHFFKEKDLHFRAVLVLDKNKLDRSAPDQAHDGFYYRIYFEMLKHLLSPHAKYHIYLDIKDSWGEQKVRTLEKLLRESKVEFARDIIQKMQIMRSHESELMQLADLLIGAVGYAARGLEGNQGKLAIIEFIKQQTEYTLVQSTLAKEEKFNLWRWPPPETTT